MMRLALWSLFVSVLLINHTSGVNHDMFKTCEQSDFCTRCRAVESGISPYELQLNTLQEYVTHIEAEIVNTVNGVNFSFKLISLIDGKFRMTINEATPLRPRYQVEYSLVRDPLEVNLEIVERTDDYVMVQSGDNRVKVSAAPFRVELYARDELVITANARGLMTFEHYLVAEEKQSWEEVFNSHRDAIPYGPSAIAMDFTFNGANHAYGIPEHADSFPLKSTKTTDPYRLYNTDTAYYELDNGMALYGAVPVLVAHSTSRTSGVFWLNSAETWVDIDNTDEPRVDAHFMSESGMIDTFFMLGPKPKDVFRQYSQLTGTAPLPPLFALGHHQSRWNYVSQEDVWGVDEGFDEHQLPLDVMWLDIEYTDGKRYFTWDPVAFSQPTEMMNNLTTKGRKLVVIIDPHIKIDSNYFLHVDAQNNGYYIKDVDGNDFEGQCWPGLSSYLDLYDPAVRNYYKDRYLLENFPGTTQDTHIWNDMNEPSVFDGPEGTTPKDLVHYGGWENRDVHNTYGMLYSMITHEALIARSGGTLRPFALTRSHFAGSQRYTAVWTGDNTADWSYLAMSIKMCLSLSVAGISFCGSDVGGFFNNPDAELLTRWHQAAAYQPFYRTHSHIDTDRREPWLFGDATLNLIRAALHEHYALLPLWYTLFFEHERTGAPVMRPIWAEFPEDEATFGIENAHMVGDSLLVHPVIEQGVDEVTVYLPGGVDQRWFSVHSYESYPSGAVTLPVDLSTIPIFQRAGAIVSRKETPRRASTAMQDDPYLIVVAPSTNGSASGTLYIDDSVSFEYRQGSYLYLALEYDGTTLTSRNIDGTEYPTGSVLDEVIIMGQTTKFSSAVVESKSIGKAALDVTYNSATHSVVVRKPGVSMAEEWSITLQP